MYIRTKTFEVTPKELRRLITIDYFKRIRRTLIMFSILVIIALILTILDPVFSVISIGLIPWITLMSCVPFFVNMKLKPRLNFMRRYYEIDENFITINYEDESMSKFRYEHFVKAVKQAEYYFLYTTPAQFHYLPVAAFNLEDEIHRFDLLLQGKQLMKL